MKTINLFAALCACGFAVASPVNGVSTENATRAANSGFALLASDIGHSYSVEDMVEIVEKGDFNYVIVDWAWITAHWNKTDFASVRQLANHLKQKHVEVAAMYRPRFLGAPTVPEQVKADGSPAFAHGRYPCFSSSAAREWSAHWGEQILEKCPEFDEIVVYNPLDLCQCGSCRRAKIQNPYDPVWSFLKDAKVAWRKKKPAVRLGVVFNPALDFWLRGQNVCDTALPFFHVREDADLARNAAEILDVRRLMGGKADVALAKVTWGGEGRISPQKLSEFARVAREHSIGWVLWTFDTLFVAETSDPVEVARSLNLDHRALEAPLRKLRATAAVPAAPHARRATNSDADAVPPLTFPVADPAIRKLPWPHQAPGLSTAEIEQLNHSVWVINNNPLYQANEAGDWAYFHGGLDIVLTNGTKIYAIQDGWVKSIVNSTITIASPKGDQPGYGWSYAHLDNFQVREGDFVKQGTRIGEVNFHGLPHTHLDKVFSERAYWRSWRFICFPDDHFSFYDNEPPTIEAPFHFFENNSDNQFMPEPDGSVVVRGDVDIVVGMRDGGEVAHSKDGGFGDRLAVTRIEYTIRPAFGNEAQVRRVRGFDFRKLRFKNGVEGAARSYNTRLAQTVFKHYTLFGKPLSGHQNLAYYIVSNCPGDDAPAELDSAFANRSWQTAAHDASGAPLHPDGEYIIEVTAFDSHDNHASQFTKVTVDNAGKRPIVAKAATSPPQQSRESNPSTASRANTGSAQREATAEEIRKISVEEWVDLIGEKETAAGYAPYTAINALPQKARESDEIRDRIIRLASATIDDASQNDFKRWQCCYVLSGIGDERGIPPIKRALKDKNETVRGVAACALGAFDHPDARAALEQAAKSESSSGVRESIQKALKGEFRRKNK